MPHDWPELPDLVATVREFLDDLVVRLDGQDRYHALCAIYLLDIAGRELAEWRREPGADDARLARLVAGGQSLTRDEVLRRLCADIRAGRHDERLDALLEELLAHVEAKVRVARPERLAADGA